jgi:diguanylate cyclase (GGDEF)-like protein
MGDVSCEEFIKDNYPAWNIMRYNGSEECFRAVRGGEANCCLVSNYRLFEFNSVMDQYGLTAVATGKTMAQSFVVKRGSDQLYSILNKTIGLIPGASVDAMIASYSYQDEKVSVLAFIKENSASVIFVITAVIVAIIVLLMQSLKNARRANEGEKLINATELDPLTALYNKGFFFQYANRLHQEDPEKPMDAIVIDVERFHSVNALHGREFGDFVLRLIGGEIRTFLGERDGIASRFDGDRFDIYCEHMDEYQQLFDRLQNRLNELSRNVSVRLFMGVMPWQADTEPGQQFDRAWSACNMARKGYQTRLIVYNQKMRDKELQEQRLLNDLHRAVEDHQFEVYYQPKYNVQGSTPVLCSAEALVRWHHPELGLIPPDQFIPLFERDGRISMVDHYVWAEAAKQIARWRDQYGVTMPVSVNLSRLDVFDPALESILEELVEKNGLERGALKLEVTESAYTDNAEHLVALIERLRSKGYEIEMDDFGTGYSSLSYLNRMSADLLKVDKAFIDQMNATDSSRKYVAAIISIGHIMNLEVIAEGVEEGDQMETLRKIGCDFIQGFIWGRPMPPEEAEKLVA